MKYMIRLNAFYNNIKKEEEQIVAGKNQIDAIHTLFKIYDSVAVVRIVKVICL